MTAIIYNFARDLKKCTYFLAEQYTVIVPLEPALKL